MSDRTDPPLTDDVWCPHTSVQRRVSGDLLCRACRKVIGRADDAQVVVTAHGQSWGELDGDR